jgi:plastocyanin
MRLALGLFATLLAVPALAAAEPARVASPSQARAVEVQVVEKEFSITLSRLRVHSGSVIVQLVNFGMDDHDLVVQGNAKGSKTYTFPTLDPGSHSTKTFKLTAGKYTLYCSIPGHRALGMVSTLTVTG